MTELLPNIFAIEVPSMAFGFDINNYGDESEFMYMIDVAEITDLPECQHDESLIVKKLGPGSYEILFTTKGVSEEQAKTLVDQQLGNGKFKDYCCTGSLAQYGGYIFPGVTESLQSLLKSKGLTAGNYLIIKKVDG